MILCLKLGQFSGSTVQILSLPASRFIPLWTERYTWGHHYTFCYKALFYQLESVRMWIHALRWAQSQE